MPQRFSRPRCFRFSSFGGVLIFAGILTKKHQKKPSFRKPLSRTSKTKKRKRTFPQLLGDKLGESLGGSQAPPSFWKVPGLPRKFPQLPQKFFGDFPGSSLTVELNSNPGVPRKFPRLPRKFPKLPRRFPGLRRRSAPFSGKPDTLSLLANTSSELLHRNPAAACMRYPIAECHERGPH